MYYCNVISMTVNPYYCSLLYYLGDVEGTSQIRVSASERQFYKMMGEWLFTAYCVSLSRGVCF